MPEGPEVKKVTDFLSLSLTGATITEIQINSGRYKRHGPFDGYERLESLLPAKVTFVSCKGKMIWLELNNCYYLTSTLGMTGSWTRVRDKHTHVTFSLDNGSEIHFRDMRNFGTLKGYSCLESFHKKLNSIGPDLLNDRVQENMFRTILQTQKKKTIVEVLMNQKLVSGIGNYLKAECLYASRISPHRLCSSLSREEISTLFKNCRDIIKMSYDLGGATIQTYRQPGGEPGEFSRRFAIYGHKKDPQGREVIKEKTKDGRTTHWVPEIQL